jgi:predicted NBD/HSP70 family sugar kinase
MMQSWQLLSEAMLLANQYNKVLYLTISTGIGGGRCKNGKIDPDFENFEPGQMVFEKDGKTLVWEDFASGRALKARMASWHLKLPTRNLAGICPQFN